MHPTQLTSVHYRGRNICWGLNHWGKLIFTYSLACKRHSNTNIQFKSTSLPVTVMSQSTPCLALNHCTSSSTHLPANNFQSKITDETLNLTKCLGKITMICHYSWYVSNYGIKKHYNTDLMVNVNEKKKYITEKSLLWCIYNYLAWKVPLWSWKLHTYATYAKISLSFLVQNGC